MDFVVGMLVAVALGLFAYWALLSGLGAVIGHLKRQARPGAAHPQEGDKSLAGKDAFWKRAWMPFWADLKTTATTPYGSQTTLQRAYAACVLLFVAAITPMPYEYYFTLRVGVCIALYFFAVAAYRQRSTHSGWLAAMVVLMILYNPIVPFHIGVQLVWTGINAATIYALYRAKLALDRAADGPPKTAA